MDRGLLNRFEQASLSGSELPNEQMKIISKEHNSVNNCDWLVRNVSLLQKQARGRAETLFPSRLHGSARINSRAKNARVYEFLSRRR